MVRVVVVDDNDPVRSTLWKSLERYRDIQVVGEADSGERGLEFIRTVTPDVVIMDAAMPRMDGAETTRKLLSENPYLYVVGHGEDPSGESSLRGAGAACFAARPAGSPS